MFATHSENSIFLKTKVPVHANYPACDLHKSLSTRVLML